MQAGLHATALEAFQYSWTHEGPLGLFASGKLVSQLSRDIPYAVFCLVSYELIQGLLKNSISSSNDSPIIAAQKRKLKDAFAGSMAGGIGSIMTQPLDVVKTRLMTGNQQYKYTSVADAISRIAREEGLLTFFVGSAPRLMHKMPANGLFFLCYEVFRGILQVNDEPSS